MLIVIATALTLLGLTGQPLCRAKPFYGYDLRFPSGGFAAIGNGGIATITNDGKTAVIPLNTEQGRQIQNMMVDHSRRVMKNTQDEIQKSFADSERFSQNLHARINNDIRRSMANAFGNMGMGFGDMGFDMDYNTDSPIPDFQNDLFNNIQNSIANSQQLSNSLRNGINGVLRDAAKQGNVRVMKVSGKGPTSAVVTSASAFGDSGTVMVAQNSQSGGTFAFSG